MKTEELVAQLVAFQNENRATQVHIKARRMKIAAREMLTHCTDADVRKLANTLIAFLDQYCGTVDTYAFDDEGFLKVYGVD